MTLCRKWRSRRNRKKKQNVNEIFEASFRSAVFFSSSSFHSLPWFIPRPSCRREAHRAAPVTRCPGGPIFICLQLRCFVVSKQRCRDCFPTAISHSGPRISSVVFFFFIFYVRSEFLKCITKNFQMIVASAAYGRIFSTFASISSWTTLILLVLPLLFINTYLVLVY